MHYIYTIYQVTNKVNNKIYIGKHKASSDNPNDDYLGSGISITRAIKKYGRENFKKEVLHIFKTEEEAYDKEAELVTIKEVEDSNYYNLQEGGHGGINRIITEECRKNISRAKMGKPSPMKGKRHAAESKAKIANSLIGNKHTDETKIKMSEIKKGVKHPLSTCPHCNKTGGARHMKDGI